MKKQITCRLCSNEANYVFQTKLLTYNVSFYLCSFCKLLQSEESYWIKEAYENSISILDTGIFTRNLDLLERVTLILSYSSYKAKWFGRESFKFKKFEGSVLDYGGGNGILVRLLRDVGFHAYWADKYSENLFSKGFEASPESKYDTILAFELFEHFENPGKEFELIFSKYNPRTVIFSTLLYGDSIPDQDWWYYAFETGQHIAFYHKDSLNYISQKYNFNLYSLDQGFHIFSREILDITGIEFLLRKKDIYLPEVKKLYNSFTFSDHEMLKRRLREK